MEKVNLLIDGRTFANWMDIEIRLSLDRFDAVRFTASFEPARAEFRKIFEPFTFKPIKVLVGGSAIFNGTMVCVDPRVDASGSTVEIQAYSRPGVLCDCTPGVGVVPSETTPTEFTKLSLLQIAKQLCELFNIEVELQGDQGPVFNRVAIKPDEDIHSFLVTLAKQRNLVMTNTPDGKLLFWSSNPGGGVSLPVVQFVEGVPPLTKVTPTFSPQSYYSQITAIAPTKVGKPGGRSTYLNPMLHRTHAFRPNSFRCDDTDRAGARQAAKARMGRMFANAVSYTIDDVPTWRDSDRKLWTPNTIMTLLAPSAMVYAESELLIREVALKQTAESETASFELVLPGAFSGEAPVRLPWREGA